MGADVLLAVVDVVGSAGVGHLDKVVGAGGRVGRLAGAGHLGDATAAAGQVSRLAGAGNLLLVLRVLIQLTAALPDGSQRVGSDRVLLRLFRHHLAAVVIAAPQTAADESALLGLRLH